VRTCSFIAYSVGVCGIARGTIGNTELRAGAGVYIMPLVAAGILYSLRLSLYFAGLYYSA
jgi:hypothetical protein